MDKGDQERGARGGTRAKKGGAKKEGAKRTERALAKMAEFSRKEAGEREVREPEKFRVGMG